jgi:hypothetical protein
MLGLDAEHLVMSDGVRVVRLHREAQTFTPEKTWEMPGELGWRVALAAAPSGDLYVTSDLRLGRLGDSEKWVEAEGGFDQHFHGVAVTPDGRLFVGRANGIFEERDPSTLAVLRDYRLGNYAVLHLCALDSAMLSVSDDGGATGLFDIRNEEFARLDCDGMKTSGLHRLSDGRLLVVGLSRRVSVFEGTTEVRAADLSGPLDDRYVQGSAVTNGKLLLACEEKGLYVLTLDDLPTEAPRPALPMPPARIRAQMEFGMQIALFSARLSNGEDISEQFTTLTATNDDETLHTVFAIAMQHGTTPPGLPDLLRSPHPRARFWAANYYGELPHLFVGRAAELVPAFADEDPAIAAAAVWSVGRIGGPVDITTVTAMLRHADAHVRFTTAVALLSLKDLVGVSALVAAVRDGAGELTGSALGHFWPRVTPALLAPVSAEQSAKLLEGMTVEEIAKVAAFELDDDITTNLRQRKLSIVAAAGRPTWNAFFAVVTQTRSPVIFENEQARITSHERAATWWTAEFARRFAV